MRSGFSAGFLIVLFALLGSGPARADASVVTSAVEWQAGQTVFLAGRDFTIDRKIDGSLTATGETISVTNNANIKGDVWIAARRVAVEGKIGGELAIRAQDALINGEVKGDVSFYGVHLAFGPDARIGGDVHYYAALPAEIDEGAKISGSMKSNVLRDQSERHMQSRAEGSWHRGWAAPGYRLSWPGAVFFGILAGIVALVSPRSSARIGDAAATQPLMSFAIGFLWLVGTPILAVVAAFTIIGLPLAFIVLMLWPLGILAGLVASILALGEIFTHRIGERYDNTARLLIGIILATLLLWIGISLPAFGPLVWLGAVTLGIGAIGLASRAKISGV